MADIIKAPWTPEQVIKLIHNINVWAEPITPGIYAAGIQTQNNSWWSMGELTPGDYNYILMKGIEHALNNLADATTNPTGTNPGDAEAG